MRNGSDYGHQFLDAEVKKGFGERPVGTDFDIVQMCTRNRTGSVGRQTKSRRPPFQRRLIDATMIPSFERGLQRFFTILRDDSARTSSSSGREDPRDLETKTALS